LRKARRLLRNEDDARDAVQTLFLHLLQEPEPTLELPFLYRTLTHRCLNLLRDDKNRARLLERESPSLRGSSRIAPDAQVLGLDVLCKLSVVVEEAVMETLVYRFFDEMGLEEIADVMGVSRKTVQNRLARAAEALAALDDAEVQS
jgi:RNA polymerase sigma factor (sigma-70 family)